MFFNGLIWCFRLKLDVRELAIIFRLCSDYTLCSWRSQAVSYWFCGFNNVCYMFDEMLLRKIKLHCFAVMCCWNGFLLFVVIRIGFFRRCRLLAVLVLILLVRCLWLLLFIYVLRNTRYICNNLNTNTWHVVIYYNDMICNCSLQLKVDKIKLIELCGTSESEFSSVSVLYVQWISNVWWFYYVCVWCSWI
jgi:hypothetical protein